MSTIRALADDRWCLTTARSAHVVGIDETLRTPAQLYWGPRLPRDADYRVPARAWWHLAGAPDGVAEAYAGWGGLRYLEPCLKATFADGTRDLRLAFASASIDDDALAITLRDDAFPFRVTLHYRAHAGCDVIERWATLANEGDAPIALERALSACWAMPGLRPCRLTHLAGQWADECHPTRDWLTQGTRVIESRRLTSGPHHYPFFALDRGDAFEHAGEVYFGTLAWSGNWKLIAEVDERGRTRASIGLNDFDFQWTLRPGETFETPRAFAGHADDGFGGASRRLHDLARSAVLPEPARPRKVLYNSWEITTFHVEERQQIELAEIAADCGVELFVVDDGWFHDRNDTKGGLGDWWPDPAKFPRGLAPLIDRVTALGMEFGLWVEPEMVSPRSAVYREHPEWVLHFPSRPRRDTSADPLPRREKDQLILNLARVDVQDWLIETFDRLLRENDVRFVKWDMNRHASEPGWPDAGGDAREVWVRYVHGLYRVWGTLRARHPNVTWQSCQSGGGRADFGILRHVDQVWASDNSEPMSRLRIQEGFSFALPACAMEAWVTEQNADRLPLAFRFHVSMTGVLGVGGALAKWPADRRAEAKRLIADYKAVRHLIHGGDLYRLRSAHEATDPALMFVAKDKSEAVVFAFQTQLAWPLRTEPLALHGLAPDGLYEIEGEPAPRSGLAWRHDGLVLNWKHEIASTMRRVRRVDG